MVGRYESQESRSLSVSADKANGDDRVSVGPESRWRMTQIDGLFQMAGLDLAATATRAIPRDGLGGADELALMLLLMLLRDLGRLL